MWWLDRSCCRVTVPYILHVQNCNETDMKFWKFQAVYFIYHVVLYMFIILTDNFNVTILDLMFCYCQVSHRHTVWVDELGSHLFCLYLTCVLSVHVLS